MSVSVGAAVSLLEPAGVRELLVAADRALFEATPAGGTRSGWPFSWPARHAVVIAAGGDRPSVGVAEQLPSGGAPLLGVLVQVGHQRRGHRLPTHGPALLAESNEALIGVEVDRPQGERRAPARSLGVQAQQQCAESRVVAAGRCNVVDLCEARVGDRGGSRAAGVAWRPFGRIVAGLDVAVVLGVPVQAAQGGDQVLAAPRPTAGVSGA